MAAFQQDFMQGLGGSAQLTAGREPSGFAPSLHPQGLEEGTSLTKPVLFLHVAKDDGPGQRWLRSLHRPPR